MTSRTRFPSRTFHSFQVAGPRRDPAAGGQGLAIWAEREPRHPAGEDLGVFAVADSSHELPGWTRFPHLGSLAVPGNEEAVITSEVKLGDCRAILANHPHLLAGSSRPREQAAIFCTGGKKGSIWRKSERLKLRTSLGSVGGLLRLGMGRLGRLRAGLCLRQRIDRSGTSFAGALAKAQGDLAVARRVDQGALCCVALCQFLFELLTELVGRINSSLFARVFGRLLPSGLAVGRRLGLLSRNKSCLLRLKIRLRCSGSTRGFLRFLSLFSDLFLGRLQLCLPSGQHCLCRLQPAIRPCEHKSLRGIAGEHP